MKIGPSPSLASSSSPSGTVVVVELGMVVRCGGSVLDSVVVVESGVVVVGLIVVVAVSSDSVVVVESGMVVVGLIVVVAVSSDSVVVVESGMVVVGLIVVDVSSVGTGSSTTTRSSTAFANPEAAVSNSSPLFCTLLSNNSAASLSVWTESSATPSGDPSTEAEDGVVVGVVSSEAPGRVVEVVAGGSTSTRSVVRSSSSSASVAAWAARTASPPFSQGYRLVESLFDGVSYTNPPCCLFVGPAHAVESVAGKRACRDHPQRRHHQQEH